MLFKMLLIELPLPTQTLALSDQEFFAVGSWHAGSFKSGISKEEMPSVMS